jgi:hypothetical protein
VVPVGVFELGPAKLFKLSLPPLDHPANNKGTAISKQVAKAKNLLYFIIHLLSFLF